MRSSSRSGGRAAALIMITGFGSWACSLDSSIPNRDSAPTPTSNGAVISGAGAPDEDANVWGNGEGPSITDILDGDGGTPNAPYAGADSGGTDSSGTPQGGVEAQGGTASGSSRGGAAAGGSGGKGSGGKAGTGGSAGATSPPAPTSLYFSEYVEGTSSNKALEIATSKRAVLDGCKVGTYFNGKSEPTVVASLSGTLEAGKVLVLCTSALAAKLGAVCAQVGNLTFNGDDAVAVSCGGKILDVIGQAGVDPGEAWGTPKLGTVDLTLRRKCTVSAGAPNETDAFDPSREWQAFPADSFEGLGSRGCP